MEHFHHTDGNSILGSIATISFAFISLNDLDHVVRIAAACVAIAAGITTVWYNIIKVNKEIKKQKDDE